MKGITLPKQILSYQYHPYSTEWGPMHWGHLKTKDFIKWDRLPIALAPDSPFDKDGCFSGNAIETSDGKHMIIYTGVVKGYDKDGCMLSEIQHQCMALGDGIDYVNSDGNGSRRFGVPLRKRCYSHVRNLPK